MAQVTQPPLRARVEAHREKIKMIVARHNGMSVGLFESVVRGEETPESDSNLLVDFGPRASLFDVARIELDAQAFLGCKVDVVSRGALNERDCLSGHCAQQVATYPATTPRRSRDSDVFRPERLSTSASHQASSSPLVESCGAALMQTGDAADEGLIGNDPSLLQVVVGTCSSQRGEATYDGHAGA